MWACRLAKPLLGCRLARSASAATERCLCIAKGPHSMTKKARIAHLAGPNAIQNTPSLVTSNKPERSTTCAC